MAPVHRANRYPLSRHEGPLTPPNRTIMHSEIDAQNRFVTPGWKGEGQNQRRGGCAEGLPGQLRQGTWTDSGAQKLNCLDLLETLSLRVEWCSTKMAATLPIRFSLIRFSRSFPSAARPSLH
eukprot:1140597-Pelagomonas_calceolata.AAC.1